MEARYLVKSTGKFGQVLSLFSRLEFAKHVKELESNKASKRFSCSWRDDLPRSRFPRRALLSYRGRRPAVDKILRYVQVIFSAIA